MRLHRKVRFVVQKNRVFSFFIWFLRYKWAHATSNYGAEKPALPPNAFLNSSAFLLPSTNMWGWLGFEPMMRSCLTRATCHTAIMPNVCDRDVGYDRIPDGPRTIPAPHKICCIYPKKSSIATKLESRGYYIMKNK